MSLAISNQETLINMSEEIVWEKSDRDLTSIGRGDLINIIKAQDNVIRSSETLIEGMRRELALAREAIATMKELINHGDQTIRILAPQEFQDPCRFCSACKMGVYHMCIIPTPK